MATTKVGLKLDKKTLKTLNDVAKTSNTSVDNVVNVLLALFIVKEKENAPVPPRKINNKKLKTPPPP